MISSGLWLPVLYSLAWGKCLAWALPLGHLCFYYGFCSLQHPREVGWQQTALTLFPNHYLLWPPNSGAQGKSHPFHRQDHVASHGGTYFLQGFSRLQFHSVNLYFNQYPFLPLINVVTWYSTRLVVVGFLDKVGWRKVILWLNGTALPTWSTVPSPIVTDDLVWKAKVCFALREITF